MADIKYIAYLDEYQKITVLISKSYYNGETGPFTLVGTKSSEIFELKIVEIADLGDRVKYSLSIIGFVTLGEEYEVLDNYQTSAPLVLGYITRTESFDKMFYYSGNDLGMTYSPEKTQFKVWAPPATQVQVVLYGQDKMRLHKMHRKSKGIWELTIHEDLELYRYRYEIINNQVPQEVIDPYGVASTENGEYSVIVDMKKTAISQPYQKPKLEQATDAIIYEVSIRDFTSHYSSQVQHQGKYLGLTEIVNDSNGPRGLAYLKDLGVTHIQILPFFDFEGIDENNPENEYNWGYNPSQYNVPEGSYATNPKDPYARIHELKHMINVLHEHGFSVIMDVVFNHVYERRTFPFDAMVPTYFYRYNYQGMPSDGSGCGNDLATERSMVRKFILDSIRFWITEYGVDGFRFDLMGLMDVDTINAVRQLCDEFDPSILLYGEGWDMNTPLRKDQKAAKYNAHQLPRIAHFNDIFRDTIKGHTFNHQDRGLALGSFSYADIGKQVLAGSSGLLDGETFTFFSPAQSINYIECHDNHTFWDRMNISNKDEGEIIRQKRQLLATAMVIFAQGIPFLHCGQEFFRTKRGIENSYKSSDEINGIDWEEVMTHQNSIDLVKGYIKIRKAHRAFRFQTTILIKTHLRILQHHYAIIEYNLKDVKAYGQYSEIRVYFNTSIQGFSLPITEEGFKVIADAFQSGTEVLKEVDREIFLAPLSTTIIVKD